jgi:hypothetical protein
MVQRAEQNFDRDYNDTYTPAKSGNAWIWGALGALALLAIGVWFASGTGPVTSGGGTSTTTEQIAPAPAPAEQAPAVEPAPAPAPAQQNTQQ